jgi:hypothetical protein
VTEAWVTDDDLRMARERFASGIDGWVQPVAHGIVTTSADGASKVEVVSGLDHRLPAIVLASVIGRSAGTQTVTVSVDQLRRAAELLAPAEAALHMPHPNLWTWRRLISERPALIEAVFVDELDDPLSSEADGLLRAALG